MPRHDRLEERKLDGSRNALRSWPHIRNPIRVTVNILVLQVARYLPLRAKNVVLRLLGVDVGENVAIGIREVFDVFYPERITIGDDTIIGAGTTILTHEATQDTFRTGPVAIGENVTVGANCTILPGVTIGDNATVSAHSLVNKDVPADAFVGGVPIESLDD